MPKSRHSKDIDQALRRLIESGCYATQKALEAELENLGHPADQSTVSRALGRLNAVKEKVDGQTRYVIRAQEALFQPAMLVKSVAYNECLVVVQTSSGAAPHIAELLDEAGLENVLGTLAGDNTIFLTPTTAGTRKTRQLAEHIRGFLGI